MRLGDFTESATVYEDARPSYPDAMLDWLLADAGVNAAATIAEFGAGTGKFTRLLDARGLQVTAVEPNDAMREQAPPMPGVNWVYGTFSEANLPDESQDWVVAAQAFHWANAETDLPELRRILRPGKRLSVLWNDRQNEQHEILRWTIALAKRMVPEYDEAYRQRDWAHILTSTRDFADVHNHTIAHTFEMTPGQYLNYWRSHNRFGWTAGETRREAFLLALKERLKAWPEETLQIPLTCQAWSVVRK